MHLVGLYTYCKMIHGVDNVKFYVLFLSINTFWLLDLDWHVF